MEEAVKFDNIYEYADLKLCELGILNEIRIQIQEMYELKNKGVQGADVDKALIEVREAYKDMLNRVMGD